MPNTELAELLDAKLGPINTAITNLTTNVNNLSSTVNKLITKTEVNKEIKALKEENDQLRERVIYLECQSRRNNLRFLGIEEPLTGEKWEDCELVIIDIIKTIDLDPSSMVIERAHRLGPRPTNADAPPRPIIVKFLSFKDREQIMQRLRLEGVPANLPDGVRIVDDYPPEIEQRRRKLLPYFHTAKNLKVRCRLALDRLTINDQTYTVNTIQDIPKEYHPPATVDVTENMIGFFRKESPLSNFYPCQFSSDAKTFSSVEKFVVFKQAEFFKDTEAVEEILRMDDPVQIKRRARKINNYNPKTWYQVQEDVMKEGLRCKFDQNDHLKEFLRKTRGKILVEASPTDRFWGAGLSLHDKRLADPTKWRGKNKLGELLVALRSDICG